jgi:RNA polymerase sigma-70 factor (ECF subfamily)
LYLREHSAPRLKADERTKTFASTQGFLNEQDLIQGCLRGSAQHQRHLYELFAGKMYAVCLRYARSTSDAADILQEGFVKVFTKLDQFQFQGSFEGWVRRIMINTALRAYQRQRFDMESNGYESLPEAPVAPDALSTLSEAEILALISRLPEGYRMVFNLVAIEGYSHAEAADMLGIQESTSRSQLTKARRWLCDQLEQLNRFYRAEFDVRNVD